MKKQIIVSFLLFFSIFSGPEYLFALHFQADSVTIPVDSVQAVSLCDCDTTRQTVIPDTIKPVFQKPLEPDNSSFLSRHDISRSDYRYTGEVLKNFRNVILFEAGGAELPHEISINGNRGGDISFLSDGVLLNNRINNSFDSRTFQTESIDSVEFIPQARSFLYGLYNNSSAVNIITRDKISFAPYSKIFVYQGPDEEGIIDAMFNIYAGNKIDLSFELTNFSRDPHYLASGSGGWQVSFRTRYMPSNNLNFVLTYNYFDQIAELNGGVDFDSTRNQFIKDPDELLYDYLEAPVIFPSYSGTPLRYMKDSRQKVHLKALSTLWDDLYSEIDFYYIYHLNEYRQNEYSTISGLPVIRNNNRYSLAGANFRTSFSPGTISFEVKGNYEYLSFSEGILNVAEDISSASVTASASAYFFNKSVKPALFAKLMRYYGGIYEGGGADISFVLPYGIQLYSAISSFSKPYSIIEKQSLRSWYNKDNANIHIFQTSMNIPWRYGESVVEYSFTKKNNITEPVIKLNDEGNYDFFKSFYFTRDEEVGALSVNTRLKYEIIQLELSGQYYFGEKELPEYELNGGLFYIDTLFNANLKLKTGLRGFYRGATGFSVYDFQHFRRVFYFETQSGDISRSVNSPVPPSFRLDFVLSAGIQDRAIFYFTFENLLNNNYYYMPWYPGIERTMRFGLSWEFIN